MNMEDDDAAGLSPEIVVDAAEDASEKEVEAVRADMAEALDIVLSADPEGDLADVLADALEEAAKTLIEEDEDADGLMDDA